MRPRAKAYRLSEWGFRKSLFPRALRFAVTARTRTYNIKAAHPSSEVDG
jgi:hypothetical protein